ncbi:MAG: cyclohydrolase II/3,4-dihydroxy-2-butanone 4-phosphate synthase, partial [Solirubrobacterales bacterium]|nr:cyclohydrolase II/3,4-dihydroxy-2-butanone 4-phosphate synthase [Solirubrobacterales bacterium]
TVVDGAGRPARLADALDDHDLGRLPIASSTALHAQARARRVCELAAACALPTRHGAFRAATHANADTGGATMALVHGDPAAHTAPLVHLHSGCLLGDVLRSQLCRCREDLEAAIGAILAEGAGLLLYTKPSAMTPLACGAGQPADAAVAAGLLRRAGVTRLRLADGDPRTEAELRALGLDVIPAGLEAAA